MGRETAMSFQVEWVFTIGSERPFNLGADFLARVNVLEEHFLKSGEMLMPLESSDRYFFEQVIESVGGIEHGSNIFIDLAITNIFKNF